MPSGAPWPTDERVVEETVGWLEQAVIGLGLCPFAKPVHAKGQIRYFVSAAETPEQLLLDLLDELKYLARVSPDETDTTLLIHPRTLLDFLDYNDFLSVAELCLEELGLDGELQIASFHPQYLYAGNEPTDLANCVTRSPYPMLHLLREASVDRAVAVFPEASVIVESNIRTLRALGAAGWAQLMARARAPRG